MSSHRVAIAGDGVDRPQLEKLAAELGVADRVEFLGAIGAEQLDALRRRSSVVVVPSLSPEVFGLVGPEALALGVPVVAYQVGGTSHWLEGAGPLAAGVEVGDVDGLAAQVRRFLREPPGEVDRQALARSVSGNLSPRRHACQLVEVYHEARAVFAEGRGSHDAASPGPTSPDRASSQP